jgi:hypothetical protein
MRRAVFLACVFSLFATFAHAQAAPGKTLAFDQDAPDLAAANSYVYRHYDDDSATGVVFSPVTCSERVPPVIGGFTCVTPFPAYTPGAHSFQATAANEAGESLKSTPFAFTFVVIPAPPKNFRIQ